MQSRTQGIANQVPLKPILRINSRSLRLIVFFLAIALSARASGGREPPVSFNDALAEPVAPDCNAAEIDCAQDTVQGVPGPRSKRPLQEVLREKVKADFSNSEFKNALMQLAAPRGINLLIDRRLDPDKRITLSARNRPLFEVFSQLAEKNGAAPRLVGTVVLIGPLDETSSLRTLISIHRDELAKQASWSKETRGKIAIPHDYSWEDLEEPRTILLRIGESAGIKWKGLETVGHDLWPAGSINDLGFLEAASLILVQFEKTVQFSETEGVVEIVPIPELVSISKTYSVPASQAEQVLAKWQEKIEELEARIERGKIVVEGTVEQHEAIERLRNPPKEEVDVQNLLGKERYTMKVRRARIRDLLKRLEEAQVKFDYDPEQLKEAGIDLDQMIEFEVQEATIEVLLGKIFEGLSVDYEIDGETVRLKPVK